MDFFTSSRIFRFALFGISALGVFFFTIGIFTPGWEITHNGNTFNGIWFMLTCVDDKCSYTTYFEKYLQEKAYSEKHSVDNAYEFNYSTAVGNQVLVLLSYVCLLGATVLSLVTAIYQKASHFSAFLATPPFLISACLIWTHIGQEAAAISAKNLVHPSADDKDHQLVPYAMVLTGFGSFLTLVVTFFYIVESVFHLKKLPQTNYEQFS